MFTGLFQPIRQLVIFAMALLVFAPTKLPGLGEGTGRRDSELRRQPCSDDEQAPAVSEAFGSYFAADGSGNQMTLLLHWDGTSWSIAPTGNPTKGGSPSDRLWAGVVPSPGNVWILGSGDDGTLAIHTATGADSSLASSF